MNRVPTTESREPNPVHLGRVRALSRLMDRSFRIPGTSFRFGLDPLLGLLPVGGDVAGALASGYVIYVAWRNGAPIPVLRRMVTNVAIDMVVGTVPVAGDLFDAGWKANARNVRILEDWLGETGLRRRTHPAVLVGIIAVLVLLLAGVVALFWWLGTLIF